MKKVSVIAACALTSVIAAVVCFAFFDFNGGKSKEQVVCGELSGKQIYSTLYDGTAVYYAVQNKSDKMTEIYKYDESTGKTQKLHVAFFANKKIICGCGRKIYCYDKNKNSWSIKPKASNRVECF